VVPALSLDPGTVACAEAASWWFLAALYFLCSIRASPSVLVLVRAEGSEKASFLVAVPS
jgi:hypothetical protein